MKDLPTLQETDKQSREHKTPNDFITGACYVIEHIHDKVYRGMKTIVYNPMQEELAIGFLMVQGFELDPVFNSIEDHLKDATYPVTISIDSNGYTGATPLDKE